MQIFRKLELAFWNASIRIMGNRRAFLIVSGATLLLILFSVLGILIRPRQSFLKTMAKAESNPLEEAPLQIEATPTYSEGGQSNLLIILVDDFTDERPQLLGVWLAGQAASAPQIVFLPIFPVVGSQEADTTSSLFNLEADGKPSAVFLELLRQKDIWWNHYLVADRTSLTDLISLVGGVDWNGEKLSGPEMAAAMPATLAEPQRALSFQARIISEICRTAPGWAQKADAEILWELFIQRFHSDLQLPAFQIAKEQINRPEGMPVCEFPTLKGISQDWSSE